MNSNEFISQEKEEFGNIITQKCSNVDHKCDTMKRCHYSAQFFPNVALFLTLGIYCVQFEQYINTDS